MSVIITNRDMSKSCLDCRCFRVDNKCCSVTDHIVPRDIRATRNKMSNCPMKSIEGLIKEIMNLDYLTIEDGSDGYDNYVDIDDVVKVIKEYCEVE